MAKNLFTLTVKTTTPADSELLVGGTGSANAYNFTWTKLKEWLGIAYDGTDNILSGKVGVGTSSPGLKLHVMDGQIGTPQTPNSNCDVVIEGTTDTGIQFFSDGQTQLRFGSSGGTGDGSIIYTHSDDNLKLTSTTLISLTATYNLVGFTTNQTGAKIQSSDSISIQNGSAPSTVSTFASFYVLAGEMWVKNGAGTASQLSSHTSDAPNWMYDDDPMPAQINKEMNDFDGIVRYTNNTRKNKLIELQFEGKKLPIGDKAKIIFIETYEDHNKRTGNVLVKDNWDDFQEREYQRSLDLIAIYEQAKKDFKATKEVKEFIQIKPEVYVKVAR